MGFGKMTLSEIVKLLKKIATTHSLSMLRSIKVNPSELEDEAPTPEADSKRKGGRVRQRIGEFEQRIRQRQQQLFEAESDTSFEDPADSLSKQEFVELDELVWSQDLLLETREFLQGLADF